MSGIYLDYCAGTYVDPRVKKAMDKYFTEEFANPNSFHGMGLEANKAVVKSREKMAKILGAKSTELVFTGCGTESCNMAIKGVAFEYRKTNSKGGHIITSNIEHHAILDACRWLEGQGFELTILKSDKYGLIKAEQVKKAIRKDTILVTIMYANNEIGTVNPVREIGKVCRERKVTFHTDACQAGLLELNVEKLKVDLMTLNASKIYGPKGIGLLYVRTGVKLTPLFHGGGQEYGLRSGTLNVPGIVGFAKALELIYKEGGKEAKRLTKLRDYLITDVLKNVPRSYLNGHSTKRLPKNANFTILDIEGESLLLRLNEEGIFCSTGSACTSAQLEPSHVILAIGISKQAAHGTIRFTLGKSTTKKDIDKLLKLLPKTVEDLRKISPVRLKSPWR
jgi:cysteine desulfurase